MPDHSIALPTEQINSVTVIQGDGAATAAQLHVQVSPSRDALTESSLASANEMRSILMDIVNSARDGERRAMEAYDLFMDIVANGGDDQSVAVSKDHALRSLETAQKCNATALKCVQLMLEGRKPVGPTKQDKSGIKISGSGNNFLIASDHKALNAAIKGANLDK